jgi:RNA polymerase sigma-70 factor, ECF subfamily
MRAMAQTSVVTSDGARQVGPVFRPGRLPAGDGERLRAEKCVARAAGGDRDALRDIYVRYSHGVYGYVRSIVADDHEAEDVTQQVFLKLMTSLPSFTAGRAQFSAWILRVARNTAIDHLRRRHRVIASDPLEWRVGASAADADSPRQLRDAINALSSDQREVLVLRQVLGLTPDEVAGRLGKSSGAVHTLYYRARVAMRANLEGAGEVPVTRRRERVAAGERESRSTPAVVQA